MEHSSRYIVLFAAAVCGVCSIFVAAAAVSLKERQELNAQLDVQEKVLVLAGLLEEGSGATRERIQELYGSRIEARAVDLATGDYVEGVDAATIDPKLEVSDPEKSREAPANKAQVRRVPNVGVVYHVKDEAGHVEELILPIHGKGLWSTLYGFLALRRDADSIAGITFYKHGETPGLGGEVDNSRWKSLWEGRRAFGPKGDVAIQVKKGQAGSPQDDPYHVDGLSGATLTSRGVTNTLAFWLSDEGFGPYLEKFRAEMGTGGN
ncbi:MAG: Na(+)-translocating NADH-quinone reductase subunit C [Myxococcota bacterium]